MMVSVVLAAVVSEAPPCYPIDHNKDELLLLADIALVQATSARLNGFAEGLESRFDENDSSGFTGH
jgi:hypothetical protein